MFGAAFNNTILCSAAIADSLLCGTYAALACQTGSYYERQRKRERESTSETAGAITVLFGVWLFPGTLCVFMGTCELVCMVCPVSFATYSWFT